MPEMIQNWIENYGSEMKEAGVTIDAILNDKNAEFESWLIIVEWCIQISLKL